MRSNVIGMSFLRILSFSSLCGVILILRAFMLDEPDG